jgi:hypothetical protein
MRKPFDVLAEGLLMENSRGDKTAIELFIAGVRGWEGGIRLRLIDGTSSSVDLEVFRVHSFRHCPIRW